MRKILYTLLVTVGMHSLCDMTWACLARYTNIHMWMIALGIVCWGLIATFFLEKIWHREVE